MPAFRTGTVDTVLSERAGLQRVAVLVDGERRPAFVLTQLIGTVATGDRVVVNTTAVDLGLGTGGWDVVHWNLTRDTWSGPGDGHVLKLRYTSLQVDTGVAEERDTYEPPPHLGDVPVVACALHSQLACVAVAFKHLAPDRRLVYVMTDGGALPLALSDLVAQLRDAGLVDATVTAGHAFGGDLEAVNVPSGLDVAVAAAHADAIVVGTGPGVVGTASRRGFSGLEVASIVDAAAQAGGRPVVALRYSDADQRDRHRGVSHHSLTALAQARSPALVPVPAGTDLAGAGLAATAGHEVVEVEVPDMAALLTASGVHVTTMGRGPDEDRGFFRFAGAAGVAAAIG